MQPSQAITDLEKPWLKDHQEYVRASASIQGDVLEYKIYNRKAKSPNQRRGTIKELSPGARLRMLKEFHRIDFANHTEPLFLTLTYPDEVCSPNPKTRNLHRQHMARRMESFTGQLVPAAWRVEWVPRKSGQYVGQIVPHWHWLIFRHRRISIKKIEKAWADTIHYEGRPVTWIKRVDRCSAIQLYMAKYISKEAVNALLVTAAYHTNVGRQYGWLRKSEIPMQPLAVRARLTEAQRAEMMRLAEEQLPWISEGREQSFTLFGDRADDARRILDGEALDEG